MTIQIPDSFGCKDHRDCREVYRSAAGPEVQFIVDLDGVGYLDSSALGLLLTLRHYAGNLPEAVTIRTACPALKDILFVANFHTLMKPDLACTAWDLTAIVTEMPY